MALCQVQGEYNQPNQLEAIVQFEYMGFVFDLQPTNREVKHSGKKLGRRL